jgi:hypothetical protein
VLEVNTRRALSKQERLDDLAEALEFTRRHLGQAEVQAIMPPGSASPGRR